MKHDENLNDLYEHAPCGYLSFLDDGLIVKANQTLLSWLGRESLAEDSKLRIHDLLNVGDRMLFETQIAPILQLQNHADEIQFNLRGASGARVPVLTTTVRIESSLKSVFVNRMSLFHISDRKKFEYELKIERQRAEARAKAKSEFLAMLSHEIRTPLNAVIGVSNLLESTTLSAEQEPFMEMLRNSSDNLMNLLNSVLDLSKLEAGKVELDKKEFQIRKISENNLSAWQGVAIKKGLRLSLSLDEGVPLMAIGDPGKISQVLSNLIGNAIKFTETGSVSLRVGLVALDTTNVTLRFEIRDTGIGIAAEKLKKIFDEFAQADIDTTSRFGGTGLGLTISQKLAALFGSRIEVESVVGKGSTFSFEIQLTLGNPLGDTHGIERIANQDGALAGLSVLVADDSSDNLELMKHLFKRWGASVDTARNGAEAVEKVRLGHFDVVLMDMRMPVMSGYEAAKIIRNSFPETKRRLPIIAFSGSTSFDGQEVEAGQMFDAVIGKPFKPLDLISKLVGYTKS